MHKLCQDLEKQVQEMNSDDDNDVDVIVDAVEPACCLLGALCSDLLLQSLTCAISISPFASQAQAPSAEPSPTSKPDGPAAPETTEQVVQGWYLIQGLVFNIGRYAIAPQRNIPTYFTNIKGL